MPLRKVFEEQREVEEAQARAGESSIAMLCIDTGSSWIAIPLESAREVVENPHVVGYPIAVEPHVGIVNLRGSVVPVVSLGLTANEVNTLIVLERPGQHPFALLARSVRPVSIEDAIIAAKSRSNASAAGVVSIGGKPIRWVSVVWLAERVFGEIENVE